MIQLLRLSARSCSVISGTPIQNALQILQGVIFLAVDLQIHVSARPGAQMLFFDGSDDLGSFLCR